MQNVETRRRQVNDQALREINTDNSLETTVTPIGKIPAAYEVSELSPIPTAATKKIIEAYTQSGLPLTGTTIDAVQNAFRDAKTEMAIHTLPPISTDS